MGRDVCFHSFSSSPGGIPFYVKIGTGKERPRIEISPAAPFVPAIFCYLEACCDVAL